MKRFISAISSLVIAATAMGGTFALSTDAATNGKVDKTIIEFTTEVGGKRTSEVTAKAGDTIPVKIYVPQSSGINTLAMKMTINGDKTLGQGTIEYPTADSDIGKAYYATDEGKKHLSDAGKVAKNEYLFGNYGITMDHKGGSGYADPYCFDSGYCTAEEDEEGLWGNGKKAGGYTNAGTVPFTDYAMNINWMHKAAVQSKRNIDAYAAAKSFLDSQDDLSDVNYKDYTPVTTWTKDEAWAYDYAFAETNLVLPADLPDGVYVLDIFKDTYVNSGSVFDADLSDPTKLKVTTTNSSIAGKDGKVAYESVPLTITVGEVKDTTTTTATTPDPGKDTTTSTTTTISDVTPGSSENVPAGTIVFNFIPQGKTYTAGKTNTVNVAKGEQVTVDLTVSNDPGTAGVQLYFTFDPALTLGRRKAGDAYDVDVTWNKDDYSYVFTTANGKNQTAADGAVMSSFIFTMPDKDGSYTIDLNENAAKPNQVRDERPVDEWPDTPYIFHGLTFIVGDAVETTTTTVTSTDTTTSTSDTTTSSSSSDTTTSSSTTETTTISTVPPVGDAVWGDVNCDNDVRINDVVLLNKYLAGNATPSAQGLINADVNHSGGPDTKDSVKIKAYLAQLIEKDALAAVGDYAG